MLFRTINNNLIEIKREDYQSDSEYYNKILSVKFKNYKKNNFDCVENILSTLLYEEKYKKK
tara:strand:+ start:410 stop:592 length:183 start_codon:yes stop_codon:yes gene_type:complete